MRIVYMTTSQEKGDMNEIDNLIIEYLEGSITPADKVKLEEWVGKSQSNQTYY